MTTVIYKTKSKLFSIPKTIKFSKITIMLKIIKMNALQTIIEQAWENRVLLQEETTKTIREVIALLDQVRSVLLSLKETHGSK
jgi:hypothetical protein